MSEASDSLVMRANLRTLAKDVLSRYGYGAGEVDIHIVSGWLSDTCVATVEATKSKTTLTLFNVKGECGLSWELSHGAHGSSEDEVTSPSRTLFALTVTLKGMVGILRGVEGYCFDDVTALASSINAAAAVAYQNGYSVKLWKE